MVKTRKTAQLLEKYFAGLVNESDDEPTVVEEFGSNGEKNDESAQCSKSIKTECIMIPVSVPFAEESSVQHLPPLPDRFNDSDCDVEIGGYKRCKAPAVVNRSCGACVDDHDLKIKERALVEFRRDYDLEYERRLYGKSITEEIRKLEIFVESDEKRLEDFKDQLIVKLRRLSKLRSIQFEIVRSEVHKIDDDGICRCNHTSSLRCFSCEKKFSVYCGRQRKFVDKVVHEAECNGEKLR